MNGLAAACGLVWAALVLSLVLKKDAPVIAFLLVLTAGMLLAVRGMELAGSAAQQFTTLLAQSGITAGLYRPVCKAVGTAAVVRVLSALCRDAGQSALAAKVELVGAVLALSFCLPLLEQVLALTSDWML